MVQPRGIEGLPESVGLIFEAIGREDGGSVARALRTLARSEPGLPADWLEVTADAVTRSDFDLLSDPFIERRFLGDNGKFFIVGPYRIRRPSGDYVKLSAIYGELLNHEPLSSVATELERIQNAPLRQRFQPMLPVRRIAGAGNFASENGDAFIVPDSWMWSKSAQGPALNDMSLQDDRFDNMRLCIERVFDADSAAFLLEPFVTGQNGLAVKIRSYEIHEAGHFTGLGLARKVADNLLPSNWYRGVEEWRADGIGFELGLRTLDQREAGNDLLSNMCIRFGMDMTRNQHVDAGTEHIGCSLLILDGLFRSGYLKIRKGKLVLADLTHAGLIRAMETHRHDALQLTKRELALDHADGIMRLYGCMEVHPASFEVLHGMVTDACRDLVVHFQ